MPFTIGGDRVPSKKSEEPRKKVLVRKQKKKGKFVTLVLNLSLQTEELKDLVRFLKKECHCGGTCKDGVIELQGNMEEIVFQALKKYPNRDINL